jgi:Flp pilus assembly protein TadG
MRRWQPNGGGDGGSDDEGVDGGSAIIEFIFVAVLVMVPLVYLIVAVADVQRSSLAVTQAAREAGRAFATSSSTGEGLARAQIAARLALADQGLDETPVLAYVASGAGCQSVPITPRLQPGAQFTICVTRSMALPGVPTLLAGRGVTTVGRYIVHVDDYRAVS